MWRIQIYEDYAKLAAIQCELIPYLSTYIMTCSPQFKVHYNHSLLHTEIYDYEIFIYSNNYEGIRGRSKNWIPK